jgi:hypothetical protein
LFDAAKTAECFAAIGFDVDVQSFEASGDVLDGSCQPDDSIATLT